MRNVVRALKAMIAVGAAITLLAPAAEAEDLRWQIAVAHRGGAAPRFGEGTMRSYQDAVANGAQILEGDIHWTKDSNDSDTVGSIVIIHDSTLDRITNCSGSVSSTLWTTIRDKCYVNVGVPSGTRYPLIRINDLVPYAKSQGKTLAINLKNSTITTAQAKQLWGHFKNSKVKVHLHASWGNRAALYKVRDQDRADSSWSINYALSTDGAGGWPSVDRVKSFGTYLYASKSIPKSQMDKYKAAKINVILWTGNDHEDYKQMTDLLPHGVIVDDVADFQAWRDNLLR